MSTTGIQLYYNHTCICKHTFCQFNHATVHALQIRIANTLHSVVHMLKVIHFLWVCCTSYIPKQLYVWLLCKLSFHAQCSMSIYQQDWLTLVFLFVNCGGFLFTSGWSVYQRLHPRVLNSKLVAMAQNGPFTADFSTILCATLMEVFSLSPLF